MSQQKTKQDSEQASRQKRSLIDDHLKRAYNETLTEPLPDRFVELLRQLRDQNKD